MARIDTHRVLVRIVVSILVAVAALATFAGAHAQVPSEHINLGIAPVNAEGNFFDVTMEPGETRQLTVDLSNHGTSSVSARTFAADAYTIHGGGFGARLDGESVTGTTLWLDYPTETLALEASKSVIRTFTISVPKDVQPGQYISSLVIQNAVPVDGDGDGVSLNQVNRQAIAVNVTVPGSTTPSLTIGDVTHSVAGVVSVVSFNVANTGNVHLKPYGEVVLRDDVGAEVIRYPIQMDSFYAGTTTQVEVPFATHLDEGTYVATLTLSDDQYGINATSGELSVDVPKAAETTIVPTDDGLGAASTTNQPQNQVASNDPAFPISIVIVIIASLIAGIGIGVVLLRLISPARAQNVASASTAQAVTAATPIQHSPVGSQPARVKPLISRSTGDQQAPQTSTVASTVGSDSR